MIDAINSDNFEKLEVDSKNMEYGNQKNLVVKYIQMELIKKYNEPTTPYNLMSAVVFRLKDPYKPTNKYYSGLNMLAEKLPTYFPGFYLRVYYDSSIIEATHESDEINKEIVELWQPLFKKIEQMPHVQLVQFKYKEFLSSEPLYHIGLFGTFMRFLPLFDFDGNKMVQDVYITDIDIDSEWRVGMMAKIYKIFKASKSQFHFKTRYCYYTMERLHFVEKQLNEKYKPDAWERIFAGTIMSKIKLPRNLLEDFFYCLKHTQEEQCNYIESFKALVNQTELLKKVSKLPRYGVTDHSFYIYGIDEFFMNSIVITYILNNKILFSYSLFPMREDLGKIFFGLYTRNEEYKNVTMEQIDLFKEIMGPHYKSHLSFYKNYDFFDSVLFGKDAKIRMPGKQRAKILQSFFYNIKKIFERILKNNTYSKYGFREDEIKCVLKINHIDEVLFTEHRY